MRKPWVLALIAAVLAQGGCGRAPAPHGVVHLRLAAESSDGPADLYERAERTLAGVPGVLDVKEVGHAGKSRLVDLRRERGRAGLEALNAALAGHRHRGDPGCAVTPWNP